MSSTATESASSTSTSPSSTSTDSGGNGSPTSNSLYLFTFLTTLLLLLAVSCGIVLRSFILRRRFRRRVEAAIAAGVLLPEQVEALRRRGPTIGERPTLWEVRIGKDGANAAVGGIQKPGYEYPSGAGDSMEGGQDDWSNVMPVSAAIIPASSKKHHVPTAPPPNHPPPSVNGEEDLYTSSRRPRWIMMGRNNTSRSILPMTAPPPPPDSVPSAAGNIETASTAPESTAGGQPGTPGAENLDKLQLTVLIAMPNANVRRYQPTMSRAANATSPPSTDSVNQHSESEKGKEAKAVNGTMDDDDDDDEIPEVVFGITEVLWDAGVDWTPRVGKADDGDDGDDNSEAERPAPGSTAGATPGGRPGR